MRRKKFGTKKSVKLTSSSGNVSKLSARGRLPQDKSSNKFIITVVAIILFFIALMVAGVFMLSKELPPLTKLERIDPEMATKVYSSEGELIHSFFIYNRSYTPFDKIPDYVIDALLSAEDRDFYNHWGINSIGILRALIVDISSMGFRQGASTLTMQLSRNLYFGSQQTITRKLKEALTAIQIERTYSKHEIIEMYLNINSFGHHSFGIQAAARRFFDKPVEELNIEESALLVGILKGPSRYSPIRHPERALKRRNVVMKMMVENGKLSKAAYDSLKNLPLVLKLKDPNKMTVAPYFTEHIRRQLNALQDSLGVNVYEDGLRVYTTLNMKFQKYMEESIEKNMDYIQERVRNQKKFKALRKTMSDSAFNELTTVQIAFVAINPHNGHILAMVGGRDYNKSQFNRVTQARRQPGSTFKPFLYTAAIDNGYSPSDEYYNQPTVEIDENGKRWTPKNYNGKVGGLMTLREALRRSVNLVAVGLINDIGPKTVRQYARRMGITTPIRAFSSLALGSSEVIPIEIISAYGVFANNGILVKPISIIKIEDKNGNVIYQSFPKKKEALSPQTTYIMNDMLQGVIKAGTGVRVRTKYHFDIPAGGKTGTTNDNTNAWFIGFTPDIVAGVWVGLDNSKFNLGRGMTGAVAALPFWADFMKTVYDSVEFYHGSFVEPEGVEWFKLCRESKKLATEYCPETYEEIFNLKYKPTEKCNIHTGKGTVRNKKRRHF
jgi:penicillin-binding protein 1A